MRGVAITWMPGSRRPSSRAAASKSHGFQCGLRADEEWRQGSEVPAPQGDGDKVRCVRPMRAYVDA